MRCSKLQHPNHSDRWRKQNTPVCIKEKTREEQPILNHLLPLHACHHAIVTSGVSERKRTILTALSRGLRSVGASRANDWYAGRATSARWYICTRRHVPHGLRPPLSRGGAGPSRHRRRLLDRPHAGDQSAVQGIRPRDRPRHHRRKSSPIRRIIPARCRTCCTPARWCSRRRTTRSTCATGAQWWQFMKGADWRHPYGPKSNINGLDNHPVVHVAYRRCAGLREMGRQGAADRGRMGIRRARRARRRRVRLGRRVHARRQAHGQHLAGRLSASESERGRLRAHLAGDRVPAERLRPARHDRQRLGVDRRLVFAEARGRRAEGLLHPGKSARRARGTRATTRASRRSRFRAR